MDFIKYMMNEEDLKEHNIEVFDDYIIETHPMGQDESRIEDLKHIEHCLKSTFFFDHYNNPKDFQRVHRISSSLNKFFGVIYKEYYHFELIWEPSGIKCAYIEILRYGLKVVCADESIYCHDDEIEKIHNFISRKVLG